MRAKILLVVLFVFALASFVSAENLITCIDSDGGIDYYKQGTVRVEISWDNESTRLVEQAPRTDSCHSNGTTETPTFIREYYCDNTAMRGVDYKCPDKCQDGRCTIPPAPQPLPPQPNIYSCTDSDGGLNYEESGHVVIKLVEWDTRYQESIYESEQEIGFDHCGNVGRGENFSKILRESHCINATISIPSVGSIDGKIYKYVEYECPYKCQDEVCVKLLELPPKLSEITPDEETGPLEIPKENREEYKCNGCQLEDKCFPFSYRKDGNFCSEDEKFVSQKESGNICENNFECSSNVCVSSQCVSEGLLQKILNWFKRLFGMN